MDLASFNYVIDLFSKLFMIREVEAWVNRMKMEACDPDVHTYTSIIECCAKSKVPNTKSQKSKLFINLIKLLGSIVK